MNNLTFGNDQLPVLRDDLLGLAGRAGLRRHAGRPHPHDQLAPDRPEVLEYRFPVLLEDFHIRAGSGGKGKWNAGDGTSRTIRFLEEMECAILSSHRKVRPFGLEGGEPGELGRTFVRRLDGAHRELAGCDQTVLEAGEAVTVITPTGGGFGDKAKRDA